MSSPNDFNKKVIAEFRANEGKVGGYFANSTLVLLHTIGAKSGLERVNPLICGEDNNRLVIVASKGGAPSHPHWYYNLVANPEVSVEYGAEQFRAQATVTEEPERTELYQKMAAVFPGFADYEKKTTRIIPVITLTRLP